MIDKICNYIFQKMRKKMPEIDDEKAEVILYGIQLIIGEIPKIFIIFGLSILFGIGWYMLFSYIVMIPYRAVSGGFHLKTHIGCIIGTSIFYFGNIFLSKALMLQDMQKYILIGITFIFGVIMISLYAPADTENLPILSKKERKIKKILSYIMLTITLLIAFFVKDSVISNILIIGNLLQTMTITRIAYKITNNKYGYETYKDDIELLN